MPEHYNSAAHLLYTLQKSGLVFRSTIDSRDIVWLLAELMSQHFGSRRRPSHADAAHSVFVAIERDCVRPTQKTRLKLVAIVGTFLGNMEVRIGA